MQIISPKRRRGKGGGRVRGGGRVLKDIFKIVSSLYRYK